MTLATCNWTGFAFDGVSLIPGAGAELQSLRVLRYTSEVGGLGPALEAAVEAGDVSAVRQLLSDQGALNTARRVPRAWAGVLGWLSAGTNAAGAALQG